MIIREFTPADLKRVFEIENMSFNQSYGIDMFKSLYDMGTGFLVAEIDGYVIGSIIFWRKYENQGQIISRAVEKNYRRLKAGTRLLSKAIQVLMMFDIANIYLEVNENNTGAYEFYKGFNFRVDRLVPNYYQNHDGAIVMYLPIIRSG
ncbi:MAG: GNAT family N-acetyltransferase [Methanobrevibacter sp.]|nr:GNAT family N-acetyltransferase [Methanobrevibacter sp.]